MRLCSTGLLLASANGLGGEGEEPLSGDLCKAGLVLFEDYICRADPCIGFPDCDGPGQSCDNYIDYDKDPSLPYGACGCQFGKANQTWFGSTEQIMTPGHKFHKLAPHKCYQNSATSCKKNPLGGTWSTDTANNIDQCIELCITNRNEDAKGCAHVIFEWAYERPACFLFTAEECQETESNVCSGVDKDEAWSCASIQDIQHNPYLGEWHGNPEYCKLHCAERGGMVTVAGARDCMQNGNVINRTECAEADEPASQQPLYPCRPEDTKVCPPEYGSWGQWGECSLPKCGTTKGQKTRSRECQNAYLEEGRWNVGYSKDTGTWQKWEVTAAGQDCTSLGPGEEGQDCDATPTAEKPECSAALNSADNPLIDAVIQHSTVLSATGDALDNNPATLWTTKYENSNGNARWTNDAALTIKFKVDFQVTDVIFTVGENNPPDGLGNLCVYVGEPNLDVKSCSPPSFGISGKNAGDKIRWFATFGEPAGPARRRRDLVNPVRSVTVKPANDPSARSIDAPVVFGDIAVDYVTNLVNECEMGSHNCHEHATCTDMAVQYSCACNAPYNGDGKTCSICPSEACWSHNATTNECTLKEDKPECSQLSCGSTSIDITFGAELFGSSEVDFVDSANAPQWNANNSQFVYSSDFDASSVTFNANGTQVYFKVWIAVKGNGDKTLDGEGKPIDLGQMAVYNKAMAVGVSYTCAYDTAVTVTSDAYQMFAVDVFGGRIGVGSLAGGFSMSLSDNGGKVVMGTDMIVAVHWAVTSLVGVVEFFFNECTVTHDTVEVAIIKNGCYAGITNTMALADTDTRQSFSYKVFKGLGVTKLEQEISCTIQICEKGQCPQPTKDTQCPAAGAYDFKYHV